ncbi:MAG: 16S rRNA (guanine(966)-N(2))-methyltransferase RsmD [Acidobacteriota bacterium]|jgi:16S rRNA (guanine(966)-N(2))-methyltransferase RsmD
MRVIGGTLRGRPLRSLPGRDIRPTGDRVREALFNILQAEVAGSRFLDLFAGTGAVGIEALSRGAAAATFVEQRGSHAGLIRRNLEACGLAARARVVEGDVLEVLRRGADGAEPYALIFLDPPYEAFDLRRAALRRLPGSGLLAPGGRIVAECPSRESRTAVQNLTLERVARYGEAALCLYRARDPEPTSGTEELP